MKYYEKGKKNDFNFDGKSQEIAASATSESTIYYPKAKEKYRIWTTPKALIVLRKLLKLL